MKSKHSRRIVPTRRSQNAELSTRTFCTFRSELSSPRRPSHVAARDVVEKLSGMNEPSMIILVTTLRRPQKRYDHRLRELVCGTGNVTIATDLGVPRRPGTASTRGDEEVSHVRGESL